MWAVYSSASGTVMIAGGAFWLSFVALADLARRSGIALDQAWIWPLLVDGLIVVATVAAVALDGHQTAWYPWTLLTAGALVSVAANAIHAVVAADTDMPLLLAASVASVPPLVLLASTHLTVVLIRSTRPRTPPEPAPAPALENPALIAPVLGGEAVETSEARPRPAAAAEPSPEADDAEPGGERRAEAARMRQELGWSNKRIARELDVHPSTVGRWLPRPDPESPAVAPADISGPGSTEPVEAGTHLPMKEATP